MGTRQGSVALHAPSPHSHLGMGYRDHPHFIGKAVDAEGLSLGLRLSAH